jgi:RNA polymerase sigma factor (sigma-70 family)
MPSPFVIDGVQQRNDPVPDQPPPAPEFDEFYRAEYPRSVRLVYTLIGGNDSVEDIVQEAFLRIYQRMATLDNPGGFLRTTIVNLCRDAHRKVLRDRCHQRVLVAKGDISPSTGELVDVLLELPYRQRATLVLRYWIGMSEAEIADTLGCRPGTVKTLASRGIDRLRKVIEK